MDTDRVLSGASDGRLYRVIAGEAFSWTTLLVEDQLGERFILDTINRALAPIADSRARELIESRSFRPWNGPVRWASVAELSPADEWTARGFEMPADTDVTAPESLNH
jgi:hypothetical protein